MKKSILQEAIMKSFSRGAIVNGGELYVCEIANLVLDWEREEPQTGKVELREFVTLPAGVFNKEVLFVDRNYIEYRSIYIIEEVLETNANMTGKDKLKIIFPVLHVTCTLEELPGIFNPSSEDEED